jgi:hypothetical protein
MKCFFTLLLISLVGCTSIDQPVAQRELVNEYYSIDRQTVSDEFWNSLLKKNEGHTLTLEGQSVSLGKLYVSATGQICRKIFWQKETSANTSNLSCKSSLNNSWYFVEAVLAEYTDNQNTPGAGI